VERKGRKGADQEGEKKLTKERREGGDWIPQTETLPVQRSKPGENRFVGEKDKTIAKNMLRLGVPKFHVRPNPSGKTDKKNPLLGKCPPGRWDT